MTSLSDHLLDRRTALKGFLALAASASSRLYAAEQPEQITGMGIVIYDFNLRRRWMKKQDPAQDLFHPLTFLKHCHSLGAGGIQANLGKMEPGAIRQLRDFAERHVLFIDAIIRPPRDKTDLDRFAAEIQTAREVGVQEVRTTIIPGRRYERFKTLEEFREFERRGEAMLQLAVPTLKKHQVALAVENHKDQRIDERVALFERLNCECIGACIDTGNSIALLDDPYEAVEALAPFAMTVHLKDQSLEMYEEGFLLGDVPLGQGSLDLKRMVNTIRKAKPTIRFALELITRDALRVPCLTEGYWAPMPDIPAQQMANIMRLVRDKPTESQEVSTLSDERQVELETANVLESLRYAGKELEI
jgi:sugar phosphate isomerase/epimerase